MASEVIELASSDEESEPTPKKSKPLTNAMVHIPNKLPGVTIKPVKTKVNTLSNGVIRKASTIPKTSNVMINPYSVKTKSNGRMQRPIINQVVKPLSKPITIAKNTIINPVHHRIPVLQTTKGKGPNNFSKNTFKVQGPVCLSNLPPTITVKRTNTVLKRVAPYTICNNARKIPKVSKEVLTVDLIDDELATPSGPQWYLRPEEQAETLKLEELNNTEPESCKLVEIIIEDSPVKPVTLEKINNAKAELSITIDDSPIKSIIDKHAQPSGSDEDKAVITKVPNSKKKLEYPKSETNKECSDKIEVQIMPTGECIKTMDPNNLGQQSMNFDYIVEIEESPIKQQEPAQHSTPKKKCPVRPHLNNVEVEITTKTKDDRGEFHPVYQSFIDLCFELENSEDMIKIVEKKIKSYYRQVPKTYTESEDFIDMVSSKILSMKAGPEKMYLYIKDIVDELNFKRKLVKSQVEPEEVKTTVSETDKHLYGEDSEFDSKRQRQIRRLEKTLKKLHRAIQKLEDQEVDFDDEEDSVYLLTERYKERLVRVHAKFCQLTNTKMPSEPRLQIDARPGQPKGPAKRLEKFINKKVPIGTPLPFPDFHDVLRCVREANDEDKLGWNEADIMEEARDLFTRCGKKLQRRRQENEWRLAASRISVDADPAKDNEELKKKLNENMQMAIKKEADVLNKYADRQNLLKLEAEEIGDKEADESPVESEDEENNAEVTSLETAEKRKERLKRLLHEKCKKSSDETKLNPKNSQPVDLDVKPATHLDTDKDESVIVQNKDGVNKENDNPKVNNEKDNESPTITNVTSNVVNDNGKTDINVRQTESLQIEPASNSDNNIQLVSDDSNKIESDIDELHLLQKLHSENEMNTSTVDSSDTDTQNAISDTLGSSSDNKKPPSDDVISIENSSYSESEMAVEKNDSPEKKTEHQISEENIVEAVEVDTEIKSPEKHIENVLNKSNNDEYNDSVENILLASSEDDEDDVNKELVIEKDDVCVNLKDDSISIGDTVIEGHKDSVTVDGSDEVILNKQEETLDSVINMVENVMKENSQGPENSQLSENVVDHSVMEVDEEKQTSNEENVKLD